VLTTMRRFLPTGILVLALCAPACSGSSSDIGTDVIGELAEDLSVDAPADVIAPDQAGDNGPDLVPDVPLPEVAPDLPGDADVTLPPDEVGDDTADVSPDESDEAVWECFEDGDCDVLAPPPVCKRYVCDEAHACSLADAPDGDACLPEDPCFESGTCQANVCVGDVAAPCDDGNPCTQSACVPMTGCQHTPMDAPCDDDNPCTQDDACAEGTCAGAPVDCNDDDVCTDDACDPLIGCLYTFNTAACDDLDACTADDVCMNGTCVAGSLVTCPDLGPCTDEVCVSPGGCEAIPNLLPCDDGDPCTVNDFCSLEGACTGLDVGCQPAPPLPMRLNALAFVEPGFCVPMNNAPCLDVTQVVNASIASDIASTTKPLNMLGVFDPFDLAGDTSKFQLAPGTCTVNPDGSKTPCKFSVPPADLEPVTFKATGTCTSGLGDPAPAPCFQTGTGKITVGVMSIIVPLENSASAGTFVGMPWPSDIVNGTITAFLSKATADTILVSIPPMPSYTLTQLLPAEKMDNVGGKDGWTLLLTYEAEQVELSP